MGGYSMLNPDYYRRRAEELRRKAAAMIDLDLQDQMKELTKEYDDLAMSAETHRDNSLYWSIHGNPSPVL
jgi:hypothetical protein